MPKLGSLQQHLFRAFKNLVAVLAISISITENCKKTYTIVTNPEVPTISPPLLNHMTFIQYLIQFKKNQAKIQTLLDFSSKVNVMTLAYAVSINSKVWLTNIEAQKIDGCTLQTFKLVLNSFKLKINLKKPGFFRKSFWQPIPLQRLFWIYFS